MKTPPPPLRVEIIERSLRCFILGLFSLLPVIGLPLAAVVLVENWRIKSRAGAAWNPAGRYLHWACRCACWGAGISSLAALVLGLMAANSASR
jgi:hypothetical protein